MREKLIELIGRVQDEGSDYSDCFIDGDEPIRIENDKLADYLIANGVTVQQWIHVSERLPEHGEVVLCCLKFKDLRILQWDSVGKWWLGYGRGDDWQTKYVTHWMPLPEPPKEG